MEVLPAPDGAVIMISIGSEFFTLKLYPLNRSSQPVQALVNILVSAVNLIDILYHALSFGAHGRDQQGNACPDIRAAHADAAQLLLSAKTNDCGTVRVAENDAGTHIQQLVHKEQPALKHFLMNEHASFRLRGYHQQYAQEIRCESGPGMIVNSEHGPIEVGLNFINILGRNINIISLYFQFDSELSESVWNNTEVWQTYILDQEFTPGHRCHADKRTDLDHVRKNPVLRTTQFHHAFYFQQITSGSADAGAHAVEHVAELLDIGFTGCIVNGSGSGGQGGGHNNIGSSGNGGLFQQ